MRIAHLIVLCLLLLASVPTDSAKPDPLPSGFSNSPAGRELITSVFNLDSEQVRTPETVPGTPGLWPQQGNKRTVDVTQLKGEARELETLVQALPEQMDQIGSGRLPKELIENLRKIEKVAKHIRGEIS